MTADLINPQPPVCRAAGAALPKFRERTENQLEKFILQVSKVFPFILTPTQQQGMGRSSKAQYSRDLGEDRDSLGREDEEQTGISPWARSKTTGIERNSYSKCVWRGWRQKGRYRVGTSMQNLGCDSAVPHPSCSAALCRKFKVGLSLFSQVRSDRRGGNSLKLCQGKFSWILGKPSLQGRSAQH